MFEKKRLLLNCDICDTRKMKEEDYSHYEQMTINADVVLVNTDSKGILNRLPLTMNSDKMIEVADDIEVFVKSVNGSYDITGKTSEVEHTILIVNGSLTIDAGTEEILKKYDEIVVNGSVKYPKGLEGFLSKMTINGKVESYPDDYVIMDTEFIIDKYFPIRAKEDSKYYVRDIVIIKDKNVDIAKLADKKVCFATKRVIVPECKIEDIVSMFDQQVEFIVVPEGMTLVYGNCTLNEEFIHKEGSRLFVYGNLKIDENANMTALCAQIDELSVKGSILLQAVQEEDFLKINAEYDKIEIIKNNRNMSNMLKVKLDKTLFDYSPDGIEVCNVAKVVIADDVTSEIILEKLVLMNCARVDCSEEQESAVAAVSSNVARIGKDFDDENGTGDILGGSEGLADTKMINADNYVM